MIFVWTMQDVVNLIVLGLIALFFLLFGAMVVLDKIQRKIKARRAKSS